MPTKISRKYPVLLTAPAPVRDATGTRSAARSSGRRVRPSCLRDAGDRADRPRRLGGQQAVLQGTQLVDGRAGVELDVVVGEDVVDVDVAGQPGLREQAEGDEPLLAGGLGAVDH